MEMSMKTRGPPWPSGPTPFARSRAAAIAVSRATSAASRALAATSAVP